MALVSGGNSGIGGTAVVWLCSDGAALVVGTALYKVFTGFDFKPSTSDLEFVVLIGYLSTTTLKAGYGYWAQVDLPNGAIISEVTYYVVDNGDTNDMKLGLYSVRLSPLQFDSYIDSSSIGLPSSPNDQIKTFAVNVTVDNNLRRYYLRVESTLATTAHKVAGARIAYSVPTTFLPAVNR